MGDEFRQRVCLCNGGDGVFDWGGALWRRGRDPICRYAGNIGGLQRLNEEVLRSGAWSPNGLEGVGPLDLAATMSMFC